MVERKKLGASGMPFEQKRPIGRSSSSLGLRDHKMFSEQQKIQQGSVSLLNLRLIPKPLCFWQCSCR